MRTVAVPFNEWLPDQPDHNNPGLVDAKNVYRRNGAYQPINAPGENSDRSAVIPDAAWIVGAWGANNGFTYVMYTDGRLKIRHLSSSGSVNTGATTWTNDAATNALAAYSPTLSHFSATSFDTFDYFATGADGLYTNSGGSSATPVLAVAGAPSPFLNVASVGDFLMGSDGTTLYWSAFNDPSDWTASQRTMAGSATMNREDLGDITGIVGGAVPLVFQEHGVSRLTFVGPPTVWDVRLISDGVGLTNVGNFIQVEGLTYFWDSTSLYVTDGASFRNLSEGKNERWGIVNGTYFASSFNMYKPVFDRFQGAILFPPPSYYQTLDIVSAGTNLNRWITYNIDQNTFTYADFHGIPEAGNLGGSSTTFFTKSDSGSWFTGAANGDTLEATLTTGHLAASPGKLTQVNRIEPIYRGSGATVALSSKEKLRDDVSLSTYRPEDTNGTFGDRANGRSTAISVRYPSASAWIDLTGVNVELREGGKR